MNLVKTKSDQTQVDWAVNAYKSIPNGNWFEFIGQEMSRARLVSRTYSSAFLGWLMLAASIPLRLMLAMLSKMDRGSSELLCYGYMVRAQKSSMLSGPTEL